PRHEGGVAVGARQGASEVEPVVDRYVVLGDGDEAGKPCLRGEQVIVRRIERVAAGDVPDGEELLRVVEEELEVHFQGIVVGTLCQRLQTRAKLSPRRVFGIGKRVTNSETRLP